MKAMADLQKLKTAILSAGRIDEEEVEVLSHVLYADGVIDREEAELLVELREKATSTCRAFDELFYAAIRRHILADGSIDTEEAIWLRQLLFADGKIGEGEKNLLRQLRAGARSVSAEFEALYDDCLGSPSYGG
jgi:hypothetical protein